MNIVVVVIIDEKYEMHEKTELPLGPLYLSAYIKKYIPDINVSIIGGLPSVRMVAEKRPDMLAISSVTDNFTHAIKFIKNFRKISNIPIVIGGHHISYLPGLLPREADVGVLFEGEVTFLDLVRLFKKNGELIQSQLEHVHGIVFWRDGKLVETKRRDLIRNLDDIPFPDRDAVELTYKKEIQHHIITSRGCPNKCRFCSSTAFWKNVRYFGPEYVVDEMQQLIERYDLKRLHIYDDLWIASKSRFFRIAELIKEKGLHKRTAFRCWVTGRTFTKDVADTLLRLNFESVMIGFETGSEKILRYLKGKSASVDENKEAIRTAKKAGLKISGTFMIGIPGETIEDVYQTKKFIMENELHSATLFLLKPLPGTKIWSYAIEKGLVSNDMPDWGILNNDDILSEKAILLNVEVVPERLNRLRMEIQNEINKKLLKSLKSQLFSKNTDISLWYQHVKRVIERPDLTWVYLKSLLATIMKMKV